ncbi:MAG: NADH-quinone oxidoreductase subunit B [Candidatus Heimdallarchaeota archaeon]|nr:NADH-quinone oxidoreductase subunit B [Candidatus Heimdallarchaeota archaeon]
MVLKKIVNWARVKSPWIIHFNTGGCNGCDIEVVDALTPRYDIERFGIIIQGSPRHADVMMVTGPITRQMAPRLKLLYEQTPDPKFVVAIGACACSGGIFRHSYVGCGGVDTAVPVDVYIPGCPPKPEAIIYGVAQLLAKLQGKEVAKIDPRAIDLQATEEVTQEEAVTE